MQWFRFYHEVVEDPKVQTLSPYMFRAWVNLLCIAAKHGGELPEFRDIGYRLHVTENRAQAIVSELIQAGLFETVDGVPRPHNWNGRQFESDVSTDRVKRFRERRRNAIETADETFHGVSPDEKEERKKVIQRKKEEKVSPSEADTETEQKKKELPAEVPKNPLLVFGEFGWVKLTSEQHAKLKEKLNGRFDEYVCRFDGWVQEAPKAKASGVRRCEKDPYATIGNWFIRDEKEGKHGGTKSKAELNAEAGRRALARLNSQNGSSG